MDKKKRNLWRIVWVTSIYAVLITILYLVVIYKVKWEDKDFSKHLYFYNCGDYSVCTTENEITDYYAQLKCDKDICPRILEIRDNLAIIGEEDNNYLFDYKDNKIVNENYLTYKFTSDGNSFIVKNNDNKMGIISREGAMISEFTYDNIIDYNYDNIVYIQDDKYGLDNIQDKLQVKPTYEEIKILNGSNFIYKKDGAYYVAAIKNEKLVTSTTYDFMYPYKDIILVAYNGGIDVVGKDLKSKLVKRIDTYYQYNRQEQQNSLNISYIDNLFRFSVYNGEGYTNYTFDIKNNKLYS